MIKQMDFVKFLHILFESLGVGSCIVAVGHVLNKFFPLRSRDNLTLSQFRLKAAQFLNDYIYDAGSNKYTFKGSEAEVLEVNEEIVTDRRYKFIERFSKTFFLRTRAGEYYMFIYHSDSKPFIKHIEHSVARVKFKKRYVPPPTDT